MDVETEPVVTKKTEVTLKKDSVITLMSNDDEKIPKTVYLTKGSDGRIVIIENLEFTLYIAIPATLDDNVLYLEMLRSYHNEICGEWRLERIIEEINELGEDILRLEKGIEERGNELYRVIVGGGEIPEKYQAMHQIYLENGRGAMFRRWREKEKGTQQMIEKKKQLRLVKMEEEKKLQKAHRIFQQFTKLMKMTGQMTQMLRDSAKRVQSIKERLSPDFFVIKDMMEFSLPVSASLTKKLCPKKATLLKLKFDNHDVMRHFLSKFRSPIKIWETREEYNEIEDEVEYQQQQREYQIMILTDATESASIYTPRENVHDEYIMRQTFQFSHADHFYTWSLPDSALRVEKKLSFYPMSQTPLQNREVFSSMEQLTKSLFQRRVGTNLLVNTLYFEFSPECGQIFTVDGRLCRENVVVLDTRTPHTEKSLREGKIKVVKPPPMQMNRNSVKKRSFYSLSKGDVGSKPLKQQSLEFATTTPEKKPKLV